MSTQVTPPTAAITTWNIDPAHSVAEFKVKHMMISNVKGHIARVSGTLTLDESDGHPDGMTTDAAGRLWIAHWGGSCVTCHDPASAAELARIELPTAHITNVAFGGPDLKTAYITASGYGDLYAVEWRCPGLKLNYNA